MGQKQLHQVVQEEEGMAIVATPDLEGTGECLGP